MPITISSEDREFFAKHLVDSSVRLEWDDDLQVVIAKDPDGFHPNHTRRYRDVLADIDHLRTRRTSTIPKELL